MVMVMVMLLDASCCNVYRRETIRSERAKAKEMEERRSSRVHLLALPYPSQGHLNPMHQFCKRLVSKGLKATIAITTFISNSMHPNSDSVQFDTISDGYDEGGFKQAGDVPAYLTRLEDVGSKTLVELIKRHESSGQPIDCVVYDAFLPWALEVTKRLSLASAAFFTQTCAVNYVYFYAHHGFLTLPVSLPVSIPGMPLLELEDMPSFISVYGSYPAYFDMVLNQFSNVDKADYVLVNTFYKLEDKVVDAMSKVRPMMTIGPTIPSFYLDKRVQNDTDYGLNLFQLDPSICLEWLSNKPKRSVVYVAFGSNAKLSQDQMEELAWGFIGSNFYFLWAVRESDEVSKILKKIIHAYDNGLLVGWSPQLKC